MPSSSRPALRVFVSSTRDDLVAERRAVEHALHRMRDTEFVGMEYFGGSDETARTESLARLDECDLYVGVIGRRYASGITADEYHRARDRNIPRRLFLSEDASPIESDPAQQARLADLRATIAAENVCLFYADPGDLAAKVVTDVHEWLRANVYDSRLRDAGFTALFADAYLEPRRVYERLDLDRFTGRQWLVASIDDFLERYASGYFVLEAEAGMGKTALLARLARERRWLHHFVELARGHEGVPHGLRNLAVQLIVAWQVRFESAPPEVTRPDFLERMLFAAAAERDRRSPGAKIVIIVDGLDESAAPYGQNVMGLPRALPPGVYVIVASRPLDYVLVTDAPRSDAVRIDRTGEPNLDDMRAYLRTVARGENVAVVLAESGIAEEKFVTTMLECSGGVWIYLRYVVLELEHGERRPLDLAKLPRGLWSYYAEYWRARRAQEDWDALQLPLLATLAAAQEDVSSSMLCALAGVALSARVERLLEEWRPFLATSQVDGERRYRCYHASLREFLHGEGDVAGLPEGERRFAETLEAATRAAHERIADRALAAWDWPSLESLRDAARRDLDGGYALRHVVAHLARARRLDDLSRLLCATWRQGKKSENVWYLVHEQTHDLAGYLGDVDRVRVAAEAASVAAIARNEPATTVTLEARCALLASSVTSVAELVGPTLLATLVERGVWTPRHAFTYAASMSSWNKTLLAMAQLLPLLPTDLRGRAFREAVTAARWSYADTLTRLPDVTPPDLMEAIVRQELELRSDDRKLAALAPRVPQHMLAMFFDTVRTGEKRTNVDVFAALAPRLEGADREWAIGRMREETQLPAYFWIDRVKLLLRLSELVGDERERLIAEALRGAREIENVASRARTLAATLPYLHSRTRDRAAREAIDAARKESLWRSEVLHDLVPSIPDALLPLAEKTFLTRNWREHARFFLPRWGGRSSRELRKVLRRIESSWDKDSTLAAIVPVLPDGLLDEAFRIAVSDRGCPQTFDVMAPRLSNDQLETAVSSVQAGAVAAFIYRLPRDLRDVIARKPIKPSSCELDDDDARDLVRRAEFASPAKRARLLEKARLRAPKLFGDTDRVLVFGAVAILSDDPAQRRSCLIEALRIIRTMLTGRWSDGTARGLLLALIPELPIDLLREALAVAGTLERSGEGDSVVVTVIPRLPEAIAVECLRLVSDDHSTLVPPAYRASEETSSRALRLVELIRKIPKRWRPELEGSVPPRLRARILAWFTRRTGVSALDAIEAMRRACPPREQVRLLLGLLPRLDQLDYGNAVAQAMIAALAIDDAAERAAALEAIAPNLHPFVANALCFVPGADDDESALRQLRQTANADAIARQLQRLDGEPRERLLDQALSSIDTMEIEEVRAWARLQLAPWMAQRDGDAIIEKARVPYATSTNWPNVIARWGSHQSPLPAWVAQRVMARSGWEHARVLAALAPHLPDAVLDEAIGHYRDDDGSSSSTAIEALAERMALLAPADLYPLWRKVLRSIAYARSAGDELHAFFPVHDRLGGNYT
ncbi:MAG: DUF4062 domain-containing protein [Thermoanaerobaculia bacterium]